MFAQVFTATEQFLVLVGFYIFFLIYLFSFLKLFYVSLDQRHLPPPPGFCMASQREPGQGYPEPFGKVIISNPPPAHS